MQTAKKKQPELLPSDQKLEIERRIKLEKAGRPYLETLAKAEGHSFPRNSYFISSNLPQHDGTPVAIHSSIQADNSRKGDTAGRFGSHHHTWWNPQDDCRPVLRVRPFRDDRRAENCRDSHIAVGRVEDYREERLPYRRPRTSGIPATVRMELYPHHPRPLPTW